MMMAVKMSFIGSPKKSGQNQKLQHRTRAGLRGLHSARHRRLAWPAYRPGPARPLWWCSRSYGAASTAWEVFTPAPWVSIERGGAGFTNERYLARFGGYPCLPGDSVELNFVARVYRRAGARIFALVFGAHCFNGHTPPH